MGQQQNTESAQEEAPEAERDLKEEFDARAGSALEPLKLGEFVGRVPGAIYPGEGEKGPLDALGRSGDFEWYVPWTPKEDTVLYRFWGDPADLTGKGNGTYYSFFPPGPVDFMRDQMSLSSRWNSMEHLDEVPIKAGTLMYIGPASAQAGYSGGGFQAFVPNP